MLCHDGKIAWKSTNKEHMFLHVSGDIFWITSLKIIHEYKPGCEHVCFRNIYKNRDLVQKKGHLCCIGQIHTCSPGLNPHVHPTSVMALEIAENPRKSKWCFPSWSVTFSVPWTIKSLVLDYLSWFSFISMWHPNKEWQIIK